MRHTAALVIVIALCLTSCKRSKVMDSFFADDDSEQGDSVEAFVGDTLHLFVEDEPPATVDELFNDFFFEFTGDMRFQKQRIRFPLVCTDGDETSRMSRGEWVDENRFAEQEFLSVIYEREQDDVLQKDTAVGQVAVDWVNFLADSIDTYHFRRYDGLWVLMDMVRMPVSQHVNGDFLHFYSQFMTDSICQQGALAEPLRLVLTPQEGDDDETQIEELTYEQWLGLKDDIPISGTHLISIDYGQQNGGSPCKTLSIEGFSNGFLMKLRFLKKEEGWQLYEIEY